jgi:hypothetical protein
VLESEWRLVTPCPRLVTLCHALSRLVTPCHALSTPCHALSRLVTLCHALSRLVTPCHAVSRRVTPHLVNATRDPTLPGAEEFAQGLSCAAGGGAEGMEIVRPRRRKMMAQKCGWKQKLAQWCAKPAELSTTRPEASYLWLGGDSHFNRDSCISWSRPPAVISQRLSVSGHQSAVTSQRSPVSGHQSAVTSQWSPVSGHQSAVTSQRSSVSNLV